MKSWTKPTDDLVKKALESVKTDTDRQYFFSKLKNPHWIEPLKAKGFFDHPPGVKPLPDGYIRYPFWPEFQYLKNVANEAAEQVVNVILGIPETENPRFYDDTIEIALKVEASLSTKLKTKILQYVRGQYRFLNPRFDQVLRYWESNGQTEAALELAKELVAFQPDPQARDKRARRKTNPEDWIALAKIKDFQEFAKARKQLDQESRVLDPQPRFGEWAYQEILEKGIRPLSEREPCQTARILLDVTASLIHLSFHQDELEEVGSKDPLTGLCKRVNESGRRYQDSKETLVLALTFACEKVYEKSPGDVSALDQALRNERWDIFARIRQHLYALHPNEQTKPWIREMILAHEDYARWDHPFEFQRMIRLACEKFGDDLLAKVERDPIFEAILSGPSKQDFREFAGDQFTEELFEERRHRFHRVQMSPFAPVLFGKYADYFQELEAQEEKPVSDDDYPPYRVEGVRSGEERSPKPAAELAQMSDEELLTFLNEWNNVHFNPEEWWVDINFRGLAKAFQSIFLAVILPDESRLNFWINNRGRIERPIYIWAMVAAIHDRVKSQQLDRLDRWFAFCEWVLSHPDQLEEKSSNRSEVAKEYPDWESSHRAVGDFVEICLEKETNVPIAAREHLAGLLDKLCTQYNRRLDEDEPVLLNRHDQLTKAINNTRSRALEKLVFFGYWIRRQLKDDQAATPEVFDVLEKRIGLGCERPLTLPEYALLGQHYIHIWGLNSDWAVEHKNEFFPKENLRAWVEAFGNFLKYTRPSKPIFDLVREDIEFALKNIEHFKTDDHEPTNRTDTLGEHLFTYYLWGIFPLSGDGSLLERFYEKTKHQSDRWSRLFDYVGRSLAESAGQLEESFKQRSIEFFNWRFEKREPSELKKFTFWLEATCLDTEWRLKSYSQILDISGSEDIEIFAQMNTLRGMLEDHTALVVECFAKLTESVLKNGNTIYIQPEKAKPILRAGLNSDDANVRENAKQARENLLRCGLFEFVDEKN